MQDKLIFREMLREIKDLAYTKDNKLNIEEVEEFFGSANLSEEQLSMVMDYLMTQRVHVKGYDKKSALYKEHQEPGEEINDTKQSNIDNDIEDKSQSEKKAVSREREYILLSYEEELNSIQPATQVEEEQLYRSAVKGDGLSKSRLIELHLRIVIDLVKKIDNKDLLTSDLIQEGNIGLMLAMDKLPGTGTLAEYRDFIRTSIVDAIQMAITENEDLKYAEKQIAGKINYLSEAVKNLEEDLEKKVSLEELAVYLEMPEKEIIDILKLAGDEIELEDHVHHSHESLKTE